MPLELHVWCPGFGLPSIDAECLGAVAYMRHCLSKGEWAVVANSDARACPLSELPALKDGEKWVSRFNNIITYLREVSNGDWDLNRSLTRQQQADCIAFTSFIESRGQPLLDLSLYVSSENYNGSTKIALSHVLTWPGSWTIPGQLRDQAKKRSEHLGLSSLDVDAAQKDAESKEKTGITAQIPERLRKPKQTVSKLLGQNAAKDRFRLDAVTAEFMEPVEELLGRKEYLLGDSMSSVDCLAIGYLALMRQSDLPHSWLHAALSKEQSRLGQWSEKTAEVSFQEPLPWLPPTPVMGTERVLAVIENLVAALPVIGRSHATIELPQVRSTNETTVHARKQKAIINLRVGQRQFDQLIFSTLSFGTFIGYMLWTGLLVLPQRTVRPGTRDFGAAGAVLGLGLR
jgi:sorting and assembly machinery component 37